MAARRNREHVAGGRAVLKTAALEKADFEDERFDKIFAFNVAPFWLQPKDALGIVRRHLAPDGAVYLFWDARHTQPGRARDLADRLSERARLAEFSVNQVLVKDLRPVPAVCVIGGPRRAAMADGDADSRDHHSEGAATDSRRGIPRSVRPASPGTLACAIRALLSGTSWRTPRTLRTGPDDFSAAHNVPGQLN